MWYIYKITNKINGKTYIGQHKYKKLNDSYMGSGSYLAVAKKKYDIENFEKEILVFNITSKEFINTLEKEYIAFYRSIGKAEYNISDGGDGANHKQTEETKKKISKTLKGHKGYWTGKKHPHMSEESKRSISEKNKGNKYGIGNKSTKGQHWKLEKGKRIYY